MLEYITPLLRVYIPIFLGLRYVLGSQKKRLSDLLKFFIISTFISLFQSFIQSALEIIIPDYIVIPIYVYLTLFDYLYSGSAYDVFLSPFFNMMIEMLDNTARKVAKERAKEKIQIKEGKQVKSKVGYVQGLMVDIFKPENIYLLK